MEIQLTSIKCFTMLEIDNTHVNGANQNLNAKLKSSQGIWIRCVPRVHPDESRLLF